MQVINTVIVPTDQHREFQLVIKLKKKTVNEVADITKIII